MEGKHPSSDLDDAGKKRKMLPRMKEELRLKSEMMRRRIRKHRREMLMLGELEGHRWQMLMEMEILEDDEEDMLWIERYREYKRCRDRERDIDWMRRMRRGRG